MAEDNTTVEKQFAIQKIYTKDISFETPNSPKVFIEKWEPSVEFNLATQVQQLDEALMEVAIKLTITVKSGELVAYLVEVSQAGIFVLGGFSDDEMGGMVGSFCPNILFPYAREVVSDLVAKGGFPQFILAPVNFDALYAQQVQQAQAQQAPSSESIN
jgi:preprotein translocase subunit SecB